jgi:hypothetical protein
MAGSAVRREEPVRVRHVARGPGQRKDFRDAEPAIRPFRLRLPDRPQPGVIDRDRRHQKDQEDQHKADPGGPALAEPRRLQPAGLYFHFGQRIAGLLQDFVIEGRVETRRRFGDLHPAGADIDRVAGPHGGRLDRPSVDQNRHGSEPLDRQLAAAQR